MRKQFVIAFLCALAFSTADARRYTGDELRAMFLITPRPNYPIEARYLHVGGVGVYRLYIDERGEVTGIRLLKKTGFPPLDIAVLKTLVRWKARPGPKREVDVPVHFVFQER
jgi:TonB family protein